MTGYVYAIECNGRVKIGYSENPERRFSKVASDAPFPCALLGSWPGDKSDELAVQDRFNAIRVHGEWFAATQDLLAFISDNVVARDARKSRFVVRKDDCPLAAWRKRRKMTQTQVAEMVGVGPSFICQMEQGVSGASLSIAMKLVEISDGEIPIESLLRRKDTHRPDLYDGMTEAAE